MRNLLEAGFEVTWFSDRHPDDIIYCICVNRQTATVTVIFRGTEGFFESCNNSSMTSFPNPLSLEDYEGNTEFIKLLPMLKHGRKRRGGRGRPMKKKPNDTTDSQSFNDNAKDDTGNENKEGEQSE